MSLDPKVINLLTIGRKTVNRRQRWLGKNLIGRVLTKIRMKNFIAALQRDFYLENGADESDLDLLQQG